VFSRNALYKSTFYLLTYLLHSEKTSHQLPEEPGELSQNREDWRQRVVE